MWLKIISWLIGGSWKTTITGFIAGVLIIVLPTMQSGEWPTVLQLVVACSVVFLGRFGKDSDMSGVRNETIQAQQASQANQATNTWPDHGAS